MRLAKLCSSGPVPCSVAAADVEIDHTDLIALLVEKQQLLEPIIARTDDRLGKV